MKDSRKVHEKVDVVVVGSGAAGSIMAAKLAQGGKSVVILEAGPEIKSADMYSSQIWARRLKWGGSPVIEKGAQPIGHGFNAGWGTGGAATHHYGTWPRFHPEDFTIKREHGKWLDWPFDYNELRPYYDRIQREVGLSGDAKAEHWRPAGDPYPMPPMPTFAQGRIISRGFEALGMTTAPTPLAINTEPYNNRPPCIWDGWCDAGCPIGALANPLQVYLPQATRAGASIRHGACVTRVLTDSSGARSTGVEYRDHLGRLHIQLAEAVVMAAFTIQNPRLLLASRSAKHPNGLANSSGLVGKYIQSHTAATIFGLFDEDTQNYMGVSTGQLINQDGYKQKRKPGGAFGSYQWTIGNAKKPNDLAGIANTRIDLFGDDLHRFMARAARGLASMTSVIEDAPVLENRLRLSAKTDRWGVPLAEVTHNAAPETLALWEYVKREGLEVMKAAGAKDIWLGGYGALHLAGGTIMGKRAADSVTNSFGQTHDVPNLVIAGAGLFPTSGGVNTTYTIHAVSLRSAEHMLANWSEIIS